MKKIENLMSESIEKLSKLICEHEFNGPYNIRASNMTAEMNCIKCGELFTWTFDEFKEI